MARTVRVETGVWLDFAGLRLEADGEFWNGNGDELLSGHPLSMLLFLMRD